MMKQSESISNLATALSKVQGKMNHASFDSKNPFLKNRYASLNSVWDACRAILADNELSVIQFPTNRGDAPVVGLKTMLLHSSGEWVQESFYLPLEDKKGISTAQAAGSIITYLRRYALSAMLGIVADEDTDGNAPKAKKAQPKAEHPPDPVEPELSDNGKTEPKPTAAQLKKLHTMGTKHYGDAWDDRRPEIVGVVTKHRSRSSKDLTTKEFQTLIDGIQIEMDKAKDDG
jgi:hypothetical protein